MGRLKVLIMKGRDYIVNSIRRFPEAIFVATVMVCLGIYVNHTNNYEDEIGKMVLSLLLSLPWFVNVIQFKEKFNWNEKRRISVSAIVFMLCIAFYFMLPEELDQIFFIRYMAGLIASFLTFGIIPYFFKRDTFSRYILYVIASFFITYFYTLVLYFGLSGLVFAVESLFDLSIDSEVYIDMLMIAVGIFGVSYFLGTLPEHNDDLMEKYIPKVFRVLFTAIVIPLLWAYTAVLYAYLVRIIIRMEWPEGIVGHLVLWYGLVVMVTQFAIKDFRERPRWVEFFYDWFAYIFIVPLIMMFITIYIRIDAYGVTLLRFFFVTVAVWYLINTIYRIVWKTYDNMVLIVTAIILTILAVFSPFNALNVSFASQNSRLEAVLNQYGMLVDGQIVPSTQLTDEQKEEINSIIRFFDKMDSLDEVNILAEDFDISDMKETFGFDYKYYYYRNGRHDFFDYYAEHEPVYSIADYDYLIVVDRRGVNEDYIDDAAYSAEFDYDEQAFILYKKGEKVYQESFEDFFKGNTKYFIDAYNQGEVLTIDRNLLDFNLHFDIHNASGEKEGDGHHYNFINGYLWIQEK